LNFLNGFSGGGGGGKKKKAKKKILKKKQTMGPFFFQAKKIFETNIRIFQI
jgi:hypothetical protein